MKSEWDAGGSDGSVRSKIAEVDRGWISRAQCVMPTKDERIRKSGLEQELEGRELGMGASS